MLIGPEVNWEGMILACLDEVPKPVEIWGLTTRLQSASEPHLMRSEDQDHYYVKFMNNRYGNGHAIFAEYAVARIGAMINAPVAPVHLVAVPLDIIETASIRVNGAKPAAGVHHGSLRLSGYSDRGTLQNISKNTFEHASLSVLYTLMNCVDDHQFLYQNQKPFRVLSVDHSAFLAKEGRWSVASLAALQDPTEFDSYFDGCGLTPTDRQPAMDALSALTCEQIACIVAAPPDSWGVTLAERVALASTIDARRHGVLALADGGT